jgi:hypothetical protein
MIDRVEIKEDEVREAELGLTVIAVQRAIAGCSPAIGWGAALLAAALEYLRERGHPMSIDDEDNVELVQGIFRDTRVALRAAVRAAESDGRLPRAK